MEKKYLAVASGRALDVVWTCQLKFAPDPGQVGRVKVDARQGKPAETRFRLLQSHEKFLLIEACPVIGRTHQIRVHLAEAGLPIVGDELYGSSKSRLPLGLRAVQLSCFDPFIKKRVEIRAPMEGVLKAYGF